MKEESNGLSKLAKQLAILIGTLSVIGGAFLWFGKTEFVCKSDAELQHKELQVQIYTHDKALALQDKTLAVTITKLENIEKVVNRIDRKLQ